MEKMPNMDSVPGKLSEEEKPTWKIVKKGSEAYKENEKLREQSAVELGLPSNASWEEIVEEAEKRNGVILKKE